jgi:hypothetical protein
MHQIDVTFFDVMVSRKNAGSVFPNLGRGEAGAGETVRYSW